MLSAAMSKTDRALETVILVLVLETKNQDYPETLKKYFKNVVNQSIEILGSPEKSVSDAVPEAVSLAVKLSSNSKLRKIFEKMTNEDDISSEQAKLALNNLEAGFDPAREPAYFSKEIYQAI